MPASGLEARRGVPVYQPREFLLGTFRCEGEEGCRLLEGLTDVDTQVTSVLSSHTWAALLQAG